MFLLSQLLYGSTPKLQLCYGTVLLLLWFDSLVTYQATTYKNVQTKESVHFALWTTLVMPFLRKDDMISKEQLIELLLFTIMTSTHAIQTIEIIVSEIRRHPLINRSNYELKNLSLIWKFNVPPKVSIKLWWNLHQSMHFLRTKFGHTELNTG